MTIDQDERSELAATLRDCVRRSGRTQSDFARLLATSPSRFSTYLSGTTIPSAILYLRALKLAVVLEHAHGAGQPNPDDAVRAVNAQLDRGDEDFALRMVLQARDDIRDFGADRLADLWSRRASVIDDQRFDVLFRAIIANEFDPHAPAWAADARLDHDWVIPDPFRSSRTTRLMTPEWLARSRIYVADRNLMTA